MSGSIPLPPISSSELFTLSFLSIMSVDLSQCEMILPTELTDGLLHDDWSILDDYIHNDEYNHAIGMLLHDIDDDELKCVSVRDDSSFSKFHDLNEYGIGGATCSTFVFDYKG